MENNAILNIYFVPLCSTGLVYSRLSKSLHEFVVVLVAFLVEFGLFSLGLLVRDFERLRNVRHYVFDSFIAGANLTKRRRTVISCYLDR